MSYLVFALGLLLAICGAVSISFGYRIIEVERGWASVIGGAAALSGGIVTIALAMILHSLAGLRALLKTERAARARLVEAPWRTEPVAVESALMQAAEAVAAPAATLPSTEDAGGAADAERPARDRDTIYSKSLEPDAGGKAIAAFSHPAEAAAAAPPAAVSRQGAEPAPARSAEATIDDVRRVVAETIKRASSVRRAEIEAASLARDAEAGSAETPLGPAPRPRPGAAPFGLPRALGLKDIAPQHFGAARAEIAAARTEASAPSDGPAATQPLAEETPPASVQTPPPELGRPVVEKRGSPPRRGDDRFNVIGRYESEGTAYVMYADGSIDARSDLGAFHFSSMAELKAFMES